jgi:hypothetical protein
MFTKAADSTDSQYGFLIASATLLSLISHATICIARDFAMKQHDPIGARLILGGGLVSQRIT